MLPASRYTRSGATLAGQPLTGLVDARKVIDLFEGGATVVLQGLHRYWPPLTRWSPSSSSRWATRARPTPT